MKINGHVTRLVNSLHVPDLDVALFSCTRHGSNGVGNTFLLGDGKMYLHSRHSQSQMIFLKMKT